MPMKKKKIACAKASDSTKSPDDNANENFLVGGKQITSELTYKKMLLLSFLDYNISNLSSEHIFFCFCTYILLNEGPFIERYLNYYVHRSSLQNSFCVLLFH